MSYFEMPFFKVDLPSEGTEYLWNFRIGDQKIGNRRGRKPVGRSGGSMIRPTAEPLSYKTSPATKPHDGSTTRKDKFPAAELYRATNYATVPAAKP